MRTTIDKLGRVVIPKAIRDELRLGAGVEVEVSAANGTVEIAIPATGIRLERRNGVLVAVADRELPPLSADAVRDVLEQTRR